MNGLVIRRGGLFLARKGCKSSKMDSGGNYWSKELQAARVFSDYGAACRAAKQHGGVVRIMKDGRAEE